MSCAGLKEVLRKLDSYTGRADLYILLSIPVPVGYAVLENGELKQVTMLWGGEVHSGRDAMRIAESIDAYMTAVPVEEEKTQHGKEQNRSQTGKRYLAKKSLLEIALERGVLDAF